MSIKNVFIVAIISLVLFIPTAELALRISCAYCTWTEQNKGQYVSPYATERPSWYYTRPPNVVSRYQQQEFDYELRTNSLGFRDIEHPVSKPPGEFRILAIGDSFTEGQGARFDHTWLSSLSRDLDATGAGRGVRVIRAGTAGSDPFFGYRILMDKLLDHRPDLVLLVVNHSDVLDVIVRGGMERFAPDGTVRGSEPPRISWLFENSHFARFVLLKLFDYTHLLITRSDRDKKAQAAVEMIADLAHRYDTELAARDIDFVLIILPFRNELKRNRYDYVGELKDLAVQSGIDVIDTKPYLYEKLQQHGMRLHQLYWPIDNHFTELGYSYLAEAVEGRIRAKIESAVPSGQTGG
jgi:lysophospholipase L1-like esterase